MPEVVSHGGQFVLEEFKANFVTDTEVVYNYEGEQASDRAKAIIADYYSQNGMGEQGSSVFPVSIDAATVFEFNTTQEKLYTPPLGSNFWRELRGEVTELFVTDQLINSVRIPIKVQDKYYRVL